jgi:MATE family multidrug resistance protein
MGISHLPAPFGKAHPMSRPAAAPASGKPRGVIVSDLIELLRLAGPVVLSRLGIMVMGLTDAIVVGHFSAQQLGFHAMAWAPTSVFVTVTVGLLVGNCV